MAYKLITNSILITGLCTIAKKPIADPILVPSSKNLSEMLDLAYII
jgi:hypothetical protein